MFNIEVIYCLFEDDKAKFIRKGITELILGKLFTLSCKDKRGGIR
jgi:hypothetical protein